LGLDVEGRKTLHQIIHTIIESGIHIILITSPGELPEEITHVAVLDAGKIIEAVPKKEYHPLMVPAISTAILLNSEIVQKLTPAEHPAFISAVKMISVNIRYGETQVLKNINWEVKRGERWCVSGPNGSGKSTLLSLVTADNPQAYANEIYLFDRKRGSGETIWDIKKNIGYVSPELHLYFESQANCYEVIASGLFDTIGLFRPITEDQHEKILLWMQLLNVSSLRQKVSFAAFRKSAENGFARKGIGKKSFSVGIG
jgi:molybdate transport system ATP-binding protein